ncbi:trichohyalin-like isoform X38 [Argopecten irradians]|uniref:trichohyalin-like isoform X38 n=1 Tax=Argopecten irradians TaxID=31199 RepID=UPI0037186F9F
MSSAMVGNGYPPNYNTYNSQPSPSHGQNLITTGVLSYSDERHQQLQDMLGSQRQKEYNQYLQKQEGYYDPHPSSRPPANEQQHYRSSPSQPHSVQTTPRRGVFYRLVSPDGGLPLGQYEEQRKYLDEQRQRDYLKMMSQKEKQEYQKREEEKVQKQVRDQKAQMQKQEQEKKLYNYNKVQKQFQEERRKDYEEFVKLQEIQNQIKLQMEKSGEEREITTEKHEKNEEIQYTQSNRTKKLSKRQNEAPRKLLVYQRGLQTPPWAEHYEVEDITTTEKIGHEDGKGKDLSNGKGLDEQPWYQNHQKSLKVPLLEKESNRNGKETYEPSILGHSDQVPSRHSNTGNAGAGRDRQDDNQTDEAKLNKYEERNTQGNDYGYNQKLSNPAQKGQQNGSFSGNERHHHSSHIEGQRINTQNSENHLWNNTRKLEYDKNFPGKKQSQDLLSEDLESWTSHQGRYGEGHRRQQGDQSRGGHVDKGQGVEGQHARKLETRHNTGQMAESQYHRNKEERRLSRGQKVEDQQSIHQNESRHGQSLTRNSQSPDDQHNDLRANGIDQQQKKYESPSGRGHWDKSHWDEGQLSKGQQEIGQNNENPKGNQKEDTEGKTFNDFMPFGGMLRRRKIDPAVLKAEFLKETQKNLNEWTLKENNPSPRRAPTPPNGLDIVTQDERTRMAREKQRQYGQELQRDMIPDLHLESFRKDPMLDRRKEERNREYNKFLDEEHNREQQRREKLENLRKQPAVQPKYDNYSNSDNHERHRHNLESERRGEYQSFLSKNGEPVYPYARNPSSDLALSRLSGGLVGGIFGDVQHETDRRRAMINQRNKEYNELKKQLPQKTVRHIPSGGSRKEVDFENQKAFPMGNDYAEKQKKLREEWRKSYEIQMEKVGHSTYKKKSYTPQVQIQISKEEGARSQRDDSFRQSWERSMETPPIVPAGIYDQKRLQINAKMQADYQVYLASQQPVNRSKEFWGTNDNPRIYPTSGEYKKRGEKMKEELREEFHSFMDKQEPPKERKKVFGDQGSVLFVSKYPDTKKHMNAERRKEMIDYLEKKNGEVPRRQGDPSVDEKNMFSDMGKAQEAHSRRMQENARQDYKNYVDHAFPEGLNRGQPSFAAGKQPPDSWYSAQPPTHRYSPPRDLGPEQNGQKSNDPYTERLQQARANEAMYRRHDHEMNGQSQRAPPPRQEAPYALH